MDVAAFRQLPLMGIVRGASPQAIEPLTEAVVASGLRTIEITMNTQGAPDLIRRMVTAASGRLTIGAGTVLSLRELHQALDAGATFIVMPTLVPEVMEYCRTHEIPVFPGALSPQEIYNAWHAGATMVKVFPAGAFGPGYFREIKGPFEQIELVAVGGVTPETIGDYFAAGASAVAFGASIFSGERLARGEFGPVKQDIRDLIESWQAGR